MINYLVRIKYGALRNHLGVINNEDNVGYFIISGKRRLWLDFEEVEILSKEPVSNRFGFIRCYWCKIKLKHFGEIINENTYYCPKCLR